jgi:dipeptidyl aminopeptidase/acylaminoacyl peptidase
MLSPSAIRYLLGELYPHMAASMGQDHVMFPGTRVEAPEHYRAATPISHVTKDDPPMLIVHGTADTNDHSDFTFP